MSARNFARRGGTAVWYFHVSDKVVSPTIRRAHPPGNHVKACGATERA
jgi:hypothetical protein